jgi:LPS-assembly protein
MTYSFNPRWTMEAKYSESILLNKPIEKLFGVNYESCCWGIRIFASHTTNNNFEEPDNAVFFELTLKGLGQVDSQVGNIFTNYNPSF